MKALLLAGGLGTRLRPLTEHLPKPMAPVMDRPWLEHLIEHLRRQGIDEFVIAVKHHASVIERRLGDGRRLGVRITYSREPGLLGTAGAIKHAEPLLSERFLVLNADIIHLTRLVPLLEFHRNTGALVTIGLTEVEDPSQYGVVEQTWDGRILRFVEKPPRALAPSRRINAGIYVMEKEVLRHIPAGREVSIERETFPHLIKSGVPVYGAPVDGYWLDMGTLERYLWLHRDVLDGRIRLPWVPAPKRPGIWIGENAQIHPTARFEPPVWVGAGARIGAACVVGPYAVVGAGAELLGHTRISNAIVLPRTQASGITAIGNAIVGPDFYAALQPVGAAQNEGVLQH
ncbi:MAG: NDP-sugar synthase [Alicyclobacillus macrosporangiidus]|uniref:NDP-sugar synthase n=1 Tax=Alicyclobacillus macrosporangiidus TaxID=392015 RepID=UPI0026EE9672|nr:NDP-sugar synthase [Alicyclobacillus macrosporangiidus]MCL6598186.1 NDP-sugar synthase [Alicyclobacillus macrosporangiidus]